MFSAAKKALNDGFILNVFISSEANATTANVLKFILVLVCVFFSFSFFGGAAP